MEKRAVYGLQIGVQIEVRDVVDDTYIRSFCSLMPKVYPRMRAWCEIHELDLLYIESQGDL